MTGRSRRIARLEVLLHRADVDADGCAVVHIPWNTSQADYDTACAMAVAEQSRRPRVAVFLPGKAPTSELWVQWVTTIKEY
jgi:hypothetical protein